jgi:RNA polymerase primary sigma factor
MTEKVNPYLIKVSIRNNLIIKAIHEAGYKNVNQFCEQNGMCSQKLTKLITFKTSPMTQEGEFRKAAKDLMEALCALPTELWTSEQLTMELKRNTNTKEVDLDAMLSVLGMNAEQALQLIQPSTPIETLEEKQIVESVGEMLKTLGPKEEKVLRMRFGFGCEEHTLEEIGNKWHLSHERIRQIEINAMRKMKHPKRSNVLKGLLP